MQEFDKNSNKNQPQTPPVFCSEARSFLNSSSAYEIITIEATLQK
jgi:hypothetical protein